MHPAVPTVLLPLPLAQWRVSRHQQVTPGSGPVAGPPRTLRRSGDRLMSVYTYSHTQGHHVIS